MDGIGIGKKDKGDCVHNAHTPNLDNLTMLAKNNNLYTELKAHGLFVGLPSNKDIGNSEVGHNAIGVGRVLFQGAELVNRSIENGSILYSKESSLVSITNIRLLLNSDISLTFFL